MTKQAVPNPSKRAGYLIIGATIAGVFAFPFLSPLQQLPKARLVLAGQVDPPVEHAVTLTAQLAHGYGLSASDTPPPPLWLTLRFSDAPDEEYVIWASRRGVDYTVMDSNEIEGSKDRASWRLHLGELLQDPNAAERNAGDVVALRRARDVHRPPARRAREEAAMLAQIGRVPPDAVGEPV